ncbi:unnamed protein product [Darwinula stevensoni]|uniref:Peptidase S1 domain-containing protein n=1 Tax=Darwinula stevensoni TaxID=69355 RepID=A0A7R8XBC3_9CRUS|nr:unnamed protein product [Darwinula stevensoni]CAG0890891.1 unnamed protein product [Darwinula stevensoni]
MNKSVILPDSNMKDLVPMKLLAFVSLLFLLPWGILQAQADCPSTAPPTLTLTTHSCGSSLSKKSSILAWLGRLFSGFVGATLRSSIEERQEARIVGGTNAAIFGAPWMAYIEAVFPEGPTICSGSIVSERWIVTAAHCIVNQNKVKASSVTVRVGSANKNTGTAIASANYFAHPDYNPATYNMTGSAGNDIALIQLPTSLTFGTTIQPICYPSSDTVTGSTISTCDQKVFGWGTTDKANTIYATLLQTQNVTVVADSPDCSSFTGGRIICVQSDVSGSEVCDGDDGGPLVVWYANRAYLTGMLSFGPFPCVGAKPDQYTRASTYADWVKSNVNP